MWVIYFLCLAITKDELSPLTNFNKYVENKDYNKSTELIYKYTFSFLEEKKIVIKLKSISGKIPNLFAGMYPNILNQLETS